MTTPLPAPHPVSQFEPVPGLCPVCRKRHVELRELIAYEVGQQKRERCPECGYVAVVVSMTIRLEAGEQ